MNEQAYSNEAAAGAMAVLGFMMIIFAIIGLIMIICLWKIFTKAGKPGWAAIIPIYSTIVLLEIVGKPVWWILLLFIPIVNVVVLIMVIHRLSVSFGKDIGMTLLLIFLPFIGFPVLAFGDSRYIGTPTVVSAV